MQGTLITASSGRELKSETAMVPDKDFRTYYDAIRWPALRVLPRAATKILDIGGGTGATALEVKRQCNGTVAGVVDVESTATASHRIGLDFCVHGNVETSDILDQVSRDYGPFDLVLCLDVLEH